MKKLILSFAVISAIFIGCSKEETTDSTDNTGKTNPTPTTPTINAKQQAAAIYFGGTWCPPCGAYGKPAKEALKKELGKSKVTIISCQLDGSTKDPFSNADGNALAGVFQVTGVPTMWIGGAEDPISQIGSNTQMSSTCVSTATTVNGKTAVANMIGTLKISASGELTLETSTKFFKEVTSEYYLAAYLLEDALNYTQASDASTEKNVHHSVLRQKLSEKVTGDLITSGTTAKDKIITKKFTLSSINSTFKTANLSAALVLWKKGADNKLTICNSIVVNQ